MDVLENEIVSKLNVNSTLSDLSLIESSFELSDLLAKVYDLFEKNKAIPGVVITQKGKFFCLLSRKRFFEIMSKPLMYDLFLKRKVEFFVADNVANNQLILSPTTTILSAASQALQRSENEIFEPIVIAGKRDYKLLDAHQLLIAQNSIQQIMNNLLREANDFKREVLAIAAHDLRNPINAILGFSGLICDHDSSLEKSKEFAVIINKTANHMNDLVNNFLVSAINNSTDFELKLTEFDALELMKFVLNNFSCAAKSKNQTLHFDFQPNDYKIISDKTCLKEIVENLISNAVKYSIKGGNIFVEISKHDIYIKIKVQDQGPGFSDEDKTKLYGRFQRLSAQPTGNESSTGLGLFITQKLVDKLKGVIDLQSIKNEGSTFSVIIPI